MTMLVEIVTRTPLWVWPLFVVLLAIGMIRLRDRRAHFSRILIAPVIFKIWGLIALAGHFAVSRWALPVWLGAATLGGAFGWFSARVAAMRRDRATGEIFVPGSVIPMVIIMTRFAATYASNVIAAIHPEFADRTVLLDLLLAGASAGYFAGWLARIAFAWPHLAPMNSHE